MKFKKVCVLLTLLLTIEPQSTAAQTAPTGETGVPEEDLTLSQERRRAGARKEAPEEIQKEIQEEETPKKDGKGEAGEAEKELEEKEDELGEKDDRTEGKKKGLEEKENEMEEAMEEKRYQRRTTEEAGEKRAEERKEEADTEAAKKGEKIPVEEETGEREEKAAAEETGDLEGVHKGGAAECGFCGKEGEAVSEKKTEQIPDGEPKDTNAGQETDEGKSGEDGSGAEEPREGAGVGKETDSSPEPEEKHIPEEEEEKKTGDAEPEGEGIPEEKEERETGDLESEKLEEKSASEAEEERKTGDSEPEEPEGEGMLEEEEREAGDLGSGELEEKSAPEAEKEKKTDDSGPEELEGKSTLEEEEEKKTGDSEPAEKRIPAAEEGKENIFPESEENAGERTALGQSAGEVTGTLDTKGVNGETKNTQNPEQERDEHIPEAAEGEAKVAPKSEEKEEIKIVLQPEDETEETIVPKLESNGETAVVLEIEIAAETGDGMGAQETAESRESAKTGNYVQDEPPEEPGGRAESTKKRERTEKQPNEGGAGAEDDAAGAGGPEGEERKPHHESTRDEKEKLEIEIVNVEPCSANQCGVSPVIVVKNGDADAAGKLEIVLESRESVCGQSKRELLRPVAAENGVLYRLPEIDTDGKYLLHVGEAGSEEKQTVYFSVNRTGTVFSYDRSKAEVALAETFSPEIRLQNIDAAEILSCMVNGREMPYRMEGDCVKISENCLREGKNQITMTVKDRAGNISVMEPWEFRILDQGEHQEQASEENKSIPVLAWLSWFFQKLLPEILEKGLAFDC